MCLFEVSVRKANAEISAELGGCTSDCAVLLATAWMPAKSKSFPI